MVELDWNILLIHLKVIVFCGHLIALLFRLYLFRQLNCRYSFKLKKRMEGPKLNLLLLNQRICNTHLELISFIKNIYKHNCELNKLNTSSRINSPNLDISTSNKLLTNTGIKLLAKVDARCRLKKNPQSLEM